ncbi:hydroxyacylglutathione hydrolase [SAR86 cluster bacterium]|nr:hydroxyacylglutathione hydrolase [SAR86 cluster bacterium]
MNILPLPAFTDNYIWLIEENGKATVVDPGDAKVVTNCLNEKNLELENILITHHHFDHTGGVEQLKKSYECNVYGPHDSPFGGIETKLKENDEISIHGSTFKIIEVPGHTLDHIAYYSEEQNTLFCGDTLFSGGCGRIFEGTPDQMYESISKLSVLDLSTKIYCTHEYTQSNLNFAIKVEPSNDNLVEYKNKIDEKRSNNEISLPTNLKLEKNINPFLRSHVAEIKENVKDFAKINDPSDLETFTAVRSLKDNS